ncbi:MAG: SUMF1/EgtB/PvdO family nonheme iron enzyme [bacterium]
MTNDKKKLNDRNFSHKSADGNIVQFNVNGRRFEMDIYEFPNRAGEYPQGNLTYGAAKRICEEAGRRLCTDAEWTEVCRGKNMNDYSYGAKFKKKNCNDLHLKRTAATSGQFKDCRTESGIYDMSANLWEWVEKSSNGILLAKGGSFRDGELSQRCEFSLKLFKVQQAHLLFDNFGVRCCRDVQSDGEK